MDDAVRDVMRMVSMGRPFERVEAHIEELALDEESKAVLWLLAWCDAQPTRVAELLGRRVAV